MDIIRHTGRPLAAFSMTLAILMLVAAPLAHYAEAAVIRTKGGAWLIEARGTETHLYNCPSGSTYVAGSGRYTLSTGTLKLPSTVKVTNSGPTGKGWTVTVQNGSNYALTLAIYVKCSSPT